VAGIDPAILTTRAGEEWSVQEHAGHLLDLEELHIGRLDDFAEGRETLRAADMKNSKTYEANHNEARLGDILSAFRATRMEFVARIEGLDEDAVKKSALHPRLQVPMRLVDLVYFAAEHDDHHLASITIVARELKGRR
jgi:uncharacterized damage-inducible protein DinB